jgi:excisionase family DNA binding protein
MEPVKRHLTNVGRLSKVGHMSNPLLTAEVAAKYGVSVRTVHRMVAKGRLEAHKAFPGEKSPYVFDPDQVAAVFAARAHQHEPARPVAA